MAEADADIGQLLAEHGYRVTVPRTRVWEALSASDGHLTVDQLSAAVHAADPSVNLASVYRALALFSELGLVRESRLGPTSASRWELAHSDHHFHVVCGQCGRVEHHGGSAVASIVTHLQRSHRFTVESVDLTVHGRCSDCRDLVANDSQ